MFLSTFGPALSANTTNQASVGPDSNFHLYLLIGQSNMAGRGIIDDESAKVDTNILMFTKEMTWVPAKDPLHFDKPDIVGVGPGLAFGKCMAMADSHVKIGLVPCAVGGTSITAWVPGAKDEVTGTHPYDDMLIRIKNASVSGVFKGVLWHQGEADRNSPNTYEKLLSGLIERVRKDLGSPELPFITGELPSLDPELDSTTTLFNIVLQGLVRTEKNYACVSAHGLKDNGDKLHLDAKSARELGKRYAEKMIILQK